MVHLLLVEDEVELARFLTRLFSLKGFEVTHVKSGAEFDKLQDISGFDLAFLDVRLPDRNGIDILQAMKEKAPACPCVIMTGYSTVKLAVDAMRFGAADFIEKPFDDISKIEELADTLLRPSKSSDPSGQADYERLAEELGIFLGQSEDLHEVYQLAYRVANKHINILIEGETGTGKEMLTKFIHAASHRSAGPLISVNCGALSETLLESELFGHVKGSFTGALGDRVGYFEAASAGTLFLDEIAEASPSTQVKLLRVLETGEYTKTGGTVSEKTETRVIAASHVNLKTAVQEGAFREDLLYRLDVVKLIIPPLRARKMDIPHLITRFLNQNEEELVFSDEAFSVLQHYEWPGNMRELANTLRHISAVSQKGAVITPAHLPSKFTVQQSVLPERLQPPDFLDEWKDFTKDINAVYTGEMNVDLESVLSHMKAMEKKLAKALIEKTLAETIGNRKEAAQKLGITDRKLRYYLNEV
ncbi:sigma-54 dependent transcriptional regulator [Sporosarcina sp. P33]|uniref:sigma-54-dependent transcriptional regulator n=1 Tax=Sporosarcina sp. P33 TaxID=1930764 RepID=UPI0009C18D35|nr:sigma-54 dependent transcriptional regulator [Sporosarcina sp. P33]ARD48805.1 hypothetical protein SporoP33_11605 [Sporosarcina sp. P33]